MNLWSAVSPILGAVSLLLVAWYKIRQDQLQQSFHSACSVSVEAAQSSEVRVTNHGDSLVWNLQLAASAEAKSLVRDVLVPGETATFELEGSPEKDNIQLQIVASHGYFWSIKRGLPPQLIVNRLRYAKRWKWSKLRERL